MELLKWFEGLRSPLLNDVFLILTELGEETIFLLIGIIILWCVNKRFGYRYVLTGLLGSSLNMLLKALFVIPRPWLLDTKLTPVEGALANAQDYSFPSGHTQSASTTYGMIAAAVKKKIWAVICIVLVLIVAVSRMYLGVHTPTDVGVSLIVGLLLIVTVTVLDKRSADGRKIDLWLLGLSLGILIAGTMWILVGPKTDRNVGSFDEAGLENMMKLLGASLGLALGRWADERFSHYETKAVWWAQVIKVICGAGLMLALKIALKPILNGLFNGAAWTHAVRYFLMSGPVLALWPLTFKWFAARDSKNVR